MTVGVVIPARYSSTRFPGKPLVPIAGKPMIQWVWERASQARGIADLVVATDDSRIADVVTAFGGKVELTSPSAPSGSDRIWEVLAHHPWQGVINVQGDEPLVDPALIERLAGSLTAGEGEVVTMAVENRSAEDFRSPNVVKVVVGEDQRALYFSRNPVPYHGDGEAVCFWHHVGIYAYTRAALQSFVQWPPASLERREKLEQLRFLAHGVRMKVLLTGSQAHGVDVPADVAKIEAILRGSS